MTIQTSVLNVVEANISVECNLSIGKPVHLTKRGKRRANKEMKLCRLKRYVLRAIDGECQNTYLVFYSHVHNFESLSVMKQKMIKEFCKL